MKTKKFIILITIFIALIGIRYHYIKSNHVIKEGSTSTIQESYDRDGGGSILLEVEETDINKDKEEIIFTYTPLPKEVIEKITGISYKENDNVKIEDLSYLQVTYWGFDDKEYIGEIIVNTKVAGEVIEIFKELHQAKFPIEKIRLIDEYDANDDLSMADNNSSAFCYREIVGSRNKLSNHSYGMAIDINPVQNPYIKKNIILPEAGTEYLDRENIRKGMIVKGDVCYNAFKSRGWTWGGEWNTLKDYQHFELNITDIGDR